MRKGLRKINWPVYNLLDRTSVNYIDEILVLSHIASGYVRKAYNRSSRVVRSGVDVERFKKSSGTEFKKRYGLENDFVFLHFGNLRTQQAATRFYPGLKNAL